MNVTPSDLQMRLLIETEQRLKAQAEAIKAQAEENKATLIITFLTANPNLSESLKDIISRLAPPPVLASIPPSVPAGKI